MPLPAAAVYYVNGPDGQVGPMAVEELVAAVGAGHYGQNVLVWWPDAEWTPFSSQPELMARLNAGDAHPVAAVGGAASSDDELDAVFAHLVKESWHYHHLIEDTTRVDEVFVGALITAGLERGRMLIDLTSDGTNHFLRFEDPDDHARVTLAVTHLTRDPTEARTLGQRAAVVFGYGERIKSFGKLFGAIRQEAKSGLLGSSEPGVVTFDADSESHYLYTQIEMFLTLDDYISKAFEVDYAKLGTHVDATVNALRKFLRGRIAAEE